MADGSKPALDLSIRGVTGLPQYAGWIYDEWLPELQGPRGRRVLREMADNDPVIGAVLFSLEMLIRQVAWKVEPGADPAASEFIEQAFDDMDRTWEDTESEILSFLPYGFSAHEILYKKRDGKASKYADGRIGWRAWPMRGQETLQRWEFDDAGNATAMVQLGPPDFQLHTIPMEKLLLFRTTTRRNNPEGRSILRNAYLAWYRKHHIEAIEGIGVERDLAGLPLIYVPSEIMADDAPDDYKRTYEQFKNIIVSVRRDEQEGVILPSNRDEMGNLEYEMKLLSTGGTRSFNTDGIIARYDQRITMTTMADFLTLGHERVGSNALAQEKGRLFVAAIGGWLAAIAGIINNHAIPRLLKLNGFAVIDPPRFVHGEVDRPDLDMLGNYVLHLAQAGLPIDRTPGGDLINELMDMANLPAPPAVVTLPVGAAPTAEPTNDSDAGDTYDSTMPAAPAGENT